jgi:predicted TIM-barrel fold metal-dependent hydrolase
MTVKIDAFCHLIPERYAERIMALTMAAPPVEAFGEAARTRELAPLANDGLAELVERHPDRFVGFGAALAMNDVDGAIEEAERAVKTSARSASRSTRT